MLNNGVLEKPKTRAKVIAWLLEGKSPTEIAGLVTTKSQPVTHQAICAFRKRHADELAPLVAEVERQIEDYAIAHKVNRIAGLDALAQKVQAWIDERGLLERSVVTTDNAEIVRERFAREVSAELRAIYRSAAEELAQLPRPAEAAVNVNVGVGFSLTWHDGTPA